MAKMRKGLAVSNRLNMLVFGAPFSGKTTFALQAAYLKRADGKPFRLIVFDVESGGCDEAIEDLLSNGVQSENILVIYTQSQKEIKSYIEKITNDEDFYVIADDGEETDEVVLDADGEPFRADCIIIDSISVLKLTTQQSLLALSQKRNKLKAEKAGATAEEKFVAVANAGLELKDYNSMNYSSQDFVLSLMASGKSVILTAREIDEKETIRDTDGKTTSVSTGRKVFDGMKGADYNCKTIIHMYQDKDTGEICGKVRKDRSKVHYQGEIITDPTLLDWQTVIDGNKNKPSFILKNDLDKAVLDDQKLFEKQMLGSDYVPEKETAPVVDDISELKKEATEILKKLAPPAKRAMKAKLEAAGLETDFKKITDALVFEQIIAILSEE